MTEQELAEKGKWFWRIETNAYIFLPGPSLSITKAKEGPDGKWWKQVERAVRSYELALRHDSIRHLSLPSFFQLSRNDQRVILSIFGGLPNLYDYFSMFREPSDLNVSVSQLFPRLVFGEGDWSRNRWQEQLDEDLSHSEKTEGRTKKRGPTGQQNRPPSWRWVELLDIAEAKKNGLFRYRAFNSAERRALSQARKASADGAAVLLAHVYGRGTRKFRIN